MKSYVFSLQLPTSPTYRSLAADVARRVIELAGGTEADAAQFAAALSEAADAIVATARGARGPVDLRFEMATPGIEVTLACAGRSSVVRHPLPAGRS